MALEKIPEQTVQEAFNTDLANNVSQKTLEILDKSPNLLSLNSVGPSPKKKPMTKRSNARLIEDSEITDALKSVQPNRLISEQLLGSPKVSGSIKSKNFRRSTARLFEDKEVEDVKQKVQEKSQFVKLDTVHASENNKSNSDSSIDKSAHSSKSSLKFGS